MTKKDSGWIWTKDWTKDDEKTARLVYFDKEVLLLEPQALDFRITADCRYKLYVNGEFVQYGPAKGDHQVHYLDTARIGEYLRAGSNRITVVVLHYPEDPAVGNHGIFSSDTPGLYLEGISLDGWTSRVDRTVLFEREEVRFAPLQIHEKRMAVGVSDSGICIRRRPEEMPAYLRRENLQDRPIPMMKLEKHSFTLPVQTVQPFSKEEFVLDAGEEMCAYVRLVMHGGAGATVRLQYSECYVLENGKGDRTDAVKGHLEGYSDVTVFEESVNAERVNTEAALKDTAAVEAARVIEPFWFRTFRFIKVTIETAEEALTPESFTYLETGYPLEVRTQVETSDPTLQQIWDISLRTLRRCMHETYVDCPYYEQLQYVMDTRSEILYTYAVSADDRLARKSILEFARAQRPDGLLNCSYPNKNVNVIPGFSLYYILMVHDHMMYFGAPSLVKTVLPAIRRILDFFAGKVIAAGPYTGLVGQIGGENEKGELWSFIDWAQEWMRTTGMPPAGLTGPITMESLLYIMGLQKAAELEEYAGDAALAEGYRAAAASVQAAVRRWCMDEEGFITDGPLSEASQAANMPMQEDDHADPYGSHNAAMRSQHCQVFGILTGTLSAEEGRRNLERSITEKGFARCSVAMCFYLFRALEETDLYEYTDRYWEVWRQMVRNHCTTCVEAEFYARSECHAWGALALYEIPTAVLGVRPTAPGYAEYEVKPHAGHLTAASGTVHTPRGDVRVSWRLEDGKIVNVL